MKIINNVVKRIILKKVYSKVLAIYLLFLLLMFVFSSVFFPVVSSKNDKTNPSVENTADKPSADVVASNHADDTSSSDTSAVESSSTDTSSDDTSSSDFSSTDSSTDGSESSTNDKDKKDKTDSPSIENTADKPSADVVAANHDVIESVEIQIVSSSEKDLGDIIIGEEIEIEPENSIESSIHTVTFTPSANQNNVKLTVLSFNGKPEEVEEIPELSIEKHEIYKYVDVKLTSNDSYIGESGVETLTFTFTVEKTWIDVNNIDKSSVLMYRFHDGEWMKLNTILISENDTMITYEAETPGLSTFAVVGNKVVESSISVVNEAPQISWSTYILIFAASAIVSAVILFKSRFIYLDKDEKESKNK